MKNMFTKIGLIVGVALIMAASAQAQTGYRANIPFDFNIGSKSYKAGVYLLTKLSPVSDSKVMVLRDSRGRNSRTMLPTNSYSDSDLATLTFRRYVDRYFLADVKAWRVGVEFSTSEIEEILAKKTPRESKTIALSNVK